MKCQLVRLTLDMECVQKAFITSIFHLIVFFPCCCFLMLRITKQKKGKKKSKRDAVTQIFYSHQRKSYENLIKTLTVSHSMQFKWFFYSKEIKTTKI